MIKKLICLIWGHKTVVKAYTGESMEMENGFGMKAQMALYVLRRLSFCKRCGKDVRHEAN